MNYTTNYLKDDVQISHIERLQKNIFYAYFKDCNAWFLYLVHFCASPYFYIFYEV